MKTVLYLQLDKNIKVTKETVTLEEIAQVTCSDPEIEKRNKLRKVIVLPKERYGRYVFSVLDLIQEIQKSEKNLEISAIGEPSFILKYEKQQEQSKILVWCKTIAVCLVTFFGTVFSIMTFNTDVNVAQLFQKVYAQFTGEISSGFTVLEITYSIGIGIGVVFFFNHFGRKKITNDPTPMQVEMRSYEDSIDTTILEQSSREGKK